eukprot:1605177-Rhodomonas_salina.3
MRSTWTEESARISFYQHHMHGRRVAAAESRTRCSGSPDSLRQYRVWMHRTVQYKSAEPWCTHTRSDCGCLYLTVDGRWYGKVPGGISRLVILGGRHRPGIPATESTRASRSQREMRFELKHNLPRMLCNSNQECRLAALISQCSRVT